MQHTNNTFDMPQLHQDDAFYCDNLFIPYYFAIEHFSDLIASNTQKEDTYQQQHPDTNPLTAISQVNLVRDFIDALHHQLRAATIQLIHEIETYFSNKYAINFVSLYPTIDQAPTTFTSYAPIIQNIFNQVGPDLQQAGTRSITQSFYASIQTNSNSYILGSIVTLAVNVPLVYFRQGAVALSPKDFSGFESILRALAILYYETTQLTPQLNNILELLKTRFHLNTYYTACTPVKVAFLQEGNLHLSFMNPANAQAFWIFYQLQQFNTNAK